MNITHTSRPQFTPCTCACHSPHASGDEAAPSKLNSGDTFVPSQDTGRPESSFDALGKKMLVAGGVGALAGLTYGVVANDYPALATIAGLGVGATLATPGIVGDHFAARAGHGIAGRAGWAVLSTVGTFGALALMSGGA